MICLTSLKRRKRTKKKRQQIYCEPQNATLHLCCSKCVFLFGNLVLKWDLFCRSNKCFWFQRWVDDRGGNYSNPLSVSERERDYDVAQADAVQCSSLWRLDNLLTKHDPEFASLIHGFNKKKCISRNIKCWGTNLLITNSFDWRVRSYFQ